MSKMMDQGLEVDDGELKYAEAIIYSMTPYERRNPSSLTAARRRRIADGSGTSLQDVNRLLKDFEKSKKMIKQMMTGKGPSRK